MTQRVCFVLALLALIDQACAPGYLKGWTSTKGMKMLQTIYLGKAEGRRQKAEGNSGSCIKALCLRNKSLLQIKPAVVSAGRDVSGERLYCRQPTTDYDRFLIQTGVKCLK